MTMEVSPMRNTPAPETNGNVTTPDGSKESDSGSRIEARELEVTATPPGYGFEETFSIPIGNASSMCECCGTVVDGHSLGEWIICDLDDLDFSPESHALVCRNCRANDPNWKEKVLERRRDRHINSRLDELIHWLSRGPVRTLFLRRAAAGIALLLTATALTTTMTVLAFGLGSLRTILASTNVVLIGGLVLSGLIGGYWLHLYDREKNDYRGTTVDEHDITGGPWSVLAFTSGGMLLGTAGIALASTVTVSSFGLATYVASVVFAFTNLEPAVRADRCIQRVNWIPRYDRELFLLRMSTVVGLALLLRNSMLGALTPVIVISAYLFARKWHDLGQNWKLLYYGGDSDSGGDD